MEILNVALTIIYVFCCLFLGFVVLIQKGEGGGLDQRKSKRCNGESRLHGLLPVAVLRRWRRIAAPPSFVASAIPSGRS